MVKQDLLRQNPLRCLGHDTDAILPPGTFGAVLARAGVGKTAFLIQIAFDYLIRETNVLYVSLNDPVEKVCLWYEEVFRNMTAKWSRKQSRDCWESLLPHRFIMTFRAETFTAPVLSERLNDLTEQRVFIPQVLLVDGFRFDEPVGDVLMELKTLIRKRSLSAWFTVRTHRHETPASDGLPPALAEIPDLFEAVIGLQPEGSEIHINVLKGAAPAGRSPKLFLDPSTLLVRNGES